MKADNPSDEEVIAAVEDYISKHGGLSNSRLAVGHRVLTWDDVVN